MGRVPTMKRLKTGDVLIDKGAFRWFVERVPLNPFKVILTCLEVEYIRSNPLGSYVMELDTTTLYKRGYRKCVPRKV